MSAMGQEEPFRMRSRVTQKGSQAAVADKKDKQAGKCITTYSRRCAGRNSVYQLAAQTLGARLTVADA